MSKKYNLGIINRSVLAAQLGSLDTTLTLVSGGGAQFPDPPFLVVATVSRALEDLDVAEFLEITGRAGDVLTIGDRNLYGQAATQTHPIGTQILEVWQPRHVTVTNQSLLDLEATLSEIKSTLDTGVITVGPDFDQLAVEPQAVPDMTVKVNPGSCFETRRLGRLNTEYTTPAFVAPSVSTRIDVVSYDVVNEAVVITTGTEGAGAPATPADNVKLAEITLATSQVDLQAGDINDSRVTL